MSKRIWALLLTLALVLGCLPAGVLAEETVPAQHTCEHCDQVPEWVQWDGTTALEDGKHYVLSVPALTLAQPIALSSGSYVLCLNGNTISGATSKRLFTLSGTAALTIVDHTAKVEDGVYTAGKLADAANSAVYVSENASFTVYDGIFTNNKGAKTGSYGGAIRADSGSKDTTATITIKGGLFTDNYADYGSAIYVKGNVTDNRKVVLTVENATFTGNTGYHTGAIHCENLSEVTLRDSAITGNTTPDGGNAAGIQATNANCKLTLGGKMLVQDNTNSMAPTKLTARNMVLGAGVKLYLDGLAQGSRIQLKSTTELTQLILPQNQTVWGCGWITLVEDSVSWIDANADGAVQASELKLGHYHDGVAYSPITSDSALPTTGGNFYLTQDVERTAVTAFNKDTNLCLNGYDIVNTGTARTLQLTKNSGATLTIEDCTAYTDEQGEYQAGAITGANISAAGPVYVNAGTTLVLKGGKISGNTANAAAGVYNVGTFTMLGGQISGNKATKGSSGCHGGGVYNAGSFRMEGGSICDNEAGNYGGGVFSNKAATFTGGTIANNKATHGGGLGLYNQNTFELGAVTITGNTATDEAGGLWVSNGATAKLEDTVITENTAPEGGGVFVRNATVTMEGGQISKNTAETLGGGVCVTGSDTTAAGFILSDGRISENAGKFGGAVMTQSNSKLTIQGGTVEGNAASAQGGGVYISSGTEFTMSGGTIANNTAQRMGGGVYNLASTSNILGGTIENNRSEEAGGGIALTAKTTLKLQGGKITGNQAPVAGGIATAEECTVSISGNPQVIGNSASNLVLADTLLLQVDAMNDGAQICVDGTPFRAISTPVTADYSGFFASDRTLYAVKLVDNALYLDAAVTHNHCACGGDANTGCDHTELKFAPWESATTLPDSGTYYLMNDVTLSEVKVLNKDLTLCLNGHTITGPEGKRFIQLTKNSGAVLTISDCTAETDEAGIYQAGAITGAKLESSGTIYVNAGTTLKLYDGKLCDNTANAGAAVYVAGTFQMYGGQLSGNKATAAEENRHGGAVMAYGADACFQLYGGTICDNEATQYGGGVFITGGAKAEFKGGTIKNNKAAQGGGIGLYKEVFELGPVTITGNTATKEGGGLLVASQASATLNGTTVSGNAAPAGAGVAVREAKLTLADGLLSGNAAAEGTGGALYGSGQGTQILIAGGKLSENTAKFGGGVLIQSQAELLMKGGTIESNSTTAQGGGVYISSKTQFTMEGGTITGNRAERLGGGVYNLASTSNITGGTIANNHSAEGGGGMATMGGTLNLAGVAIKGNTTDKHGGGLYVRNTTGKDAEGNSISVPGTAKLGKGTTISGNQTGKEGTGGGFFVSGEGSLALLEGAAVSNNTAKYGAGGICQSKGSITMTAGKVSGNSATSNGGGLYISSNTTLKLQGGSVTGNKTSASGGGIYFLRSNLQMSGGSVSGNSAKVDGGGMYLMLGNSTVTGGSVNENTAKNAGGIRMTGGKHRISGLSISYNVAEADAGGLEVGRQMVKENGVNVDKLPDFVINSATIVGNKSKNGGGMLLLSQNAQYYINNATISKNQATNGGGGIYVSSGTTLHMKDSTVSDNYSKTGGGIQHLASVGDYENVVISGNTGNNAAGMNITKSTKAPTVLKKVTFRENVGQASGAVVVQGLGTRLIAEDCTFIGNSTPKTGGAIFVTTKATAEMTNATFQDNSAGDDAGAVMLGLNSKLEITGVTFTGNTAGGNGGGVYNRGMMTLRDCVATGNTAGNNGGGIGSGKTGSTHTGDACGLFLYNVISTGNTAGNNGGGLFGSLGCHVIAEDLVLKDNTAIKGSAAWVQEDFIVENLEATGNTATEQGAVYLAASHYDGQSYFCGVMKLSGKLVVKDNQGGGIYVGEQTTLTLAGNGLAEGSYMDVTLFDGLLTQKVRGVYHYEGSELSYVITPGDRSVTDPQVLAAPEEAPQEGTEPTQGGQQEADRQSDDNTMLYVGIGAIALILVAAMAVLVVLKKKKAGAKSSGGQ